MWLMVQSFSLRNVQLVVGEPMYPSGQEHTGLWLITWQWAVGAQGSWYAQGFIQSLFSHAVWSGHSSLFEQPSANVASVDGVTIKNQTTFSEPTHIYLWKFAKKFVLKSSKFQYYSGDKLFVKSTKIS
jgi:hypothetical protein